MSPILLTGGSGRLGTELQTHLDVIAPSSSDLDITKPDGIEATMTKVKPSCLVHLAAYTDVANAEKDKASCWKVNVTGTRNLVQAALKHDVPIIHISTDYVFYGDKGMYKEDDPLGPVRNYYALSKLVAEETIRLSPKHLVIRTSFRPAEWPYPVAFDDLFTSQDYVDIIAPDIALAISHYRDIPNQTLHIASERKSVYDLAKRRKPDVKRGSKANANVALPDDVSLDTERWQTLKKAWL